MNKKNILGILCVLLCVAGCSEWKEAEPMRFFYAGTQGQTGENGPDVPSTGEAFSFSEKYYENLRAYKESPHPLMIGWFGGWSGYGSDVPGQGALVNLPDSIDAVCLWLFTGNGNVEACRRDAKEFHRKGGKTLMCWSARNLGDGVTPPEWKGRETELYGEGDEGLANYAQAIVDTCVKYHIDGFENDMEGGGPLITDAHSCNVFLNELMDRFEKAHEEHPDDVAGLVSVDIPIWQSYAGTHYPILADSTITRLYLIQWQSYTELDGNMDSYMNSIHGYNPGMFETMMSKAIFTATFERGDDDKARLKKGISTYVAGNRVFYGCEPAGFGAYHIEYDYANNEYAYVRECISMLNPPVTE